MRIEAAQGQLVAEAVRDILDGTPLLSMGTVCPDGTPWLHNAYFASDPDLRLYCLTRPGSRHVKNLPNSDGRVSVSVADTGQEGRPGTRRGVQLQGVCAPATGARLALGAELFGRRFPAFAQAARQASRVAAANAPLVLHQITVDALTVFDERTFGLERWVSGLVRRDRVTAA
jgi:uncharacterized protein YhbP (UPF0306 family)